MNKAEARDQLLTQVVIEADRAAAQIPVCGMCGKPSPNGDPCERCAVKVESMNKSEIAERAAREIWCMQAGFPLGELPETLDRVELAEIELFKEIVERAIAESQAWISVEEKLPTENGEYFIVEPGDEYLTPADWRDGKWYSVRGYGWEGEPDEFHNVSYWMIPPKPPKGNENV